MKNSLNLIPPATQRRLVTRRVVRVGSTAMLLSGLCVASLLGVEWVRGVAAARELRTLEARNAPLEELRQERARLARQITLLEGREQLSLRLAHGEHGVALLAAIAQAAGEGDGLVYVQSLEYQVADSGDSQRSLRVVGAGVDGMAVARFAERLRSTGVFDTVSIEATGPMPGGGDNLRRFDLACRL